MLDGMIVQQKIIAAFADVPRPDFSLIKTLGCCELHEQDFNWYRQHIWQEFEQAYDTKGFDSADFIAIHPLAFHYFTPGVIGTVINRLTNNPEAQYSLDDSWLKHYIISPSRQQDFQKHYVPHFNQLQREAIAAMLSWYGEWFELMHGYAPDDFDDGEETEEDKRGTIRDSIKFVWLADKDSQFMNETIS